MKILPEDLSFCIIKITVKIIVLFFIVLCSINIIAQQLEWAARYTGSAGYEQHINDAVTDKYGNTYICGFIQLPNQIDTKDAIILKVNYAGVVEWSRIYAGIDNLGDDFLAIDLYNNGNLVVTGHTISNNTSLDILTIKYNNSGGSIWTRKFDNSNDVDQGRDIKTDIYENTYITGYSYFPGPNSDYITIKYDSAGNHIWTRFYGGSGNLTDIGNKISIDDSNNIIISGLNSRDLSYNDVATLKYDANGGLFWSKIYSGENNGGAIGSGDLQTDKFGNIYFHTAIPNGPRRIVKYNVNGDSIWIKPLPSGVFPVAMKVEQNFFYLSANKAGDFHTYKFKPEGDSLWKRIYPVQTYQSDDSPQDAIADEKGNFYITGFCDSNWLAYDYLTVKYDSSGNLKWSKRYSLALFADDKAYKIGLDTADNIYVTGISSGQITTIKYSQPPVGVINIGSEIPNDYKLYQNYPNPFNPQTKIKYTNKDNSSKVQLIVTDILGRQVVKLVDEIQNAGVYEASFDAIGKSSGIYFYRLIVDGKIIDTKKMIILK